MKNKKLLLLSLGLFTLFPFLNGCHSGSKANVTYVRVLNSEDYIYLYEGGHPVKDEIPEKDEDGNPLTNKERQLYISFKQDLIDQFTDYMKIYHPELGEVKVIYEKSDTNETIYNQLTTGKSMYDVVCVSDYMIQRFIYEGMLDKLPENKDEIISNYFGENNDSCKYIRDRFSSIPATEFVEKDGKSIRKSTSVGEYSVGYMWGSLGILYNPAFEGFKKEILEDEYKIHDDAQSWEIFKNSDYNKVATIKNSMRDTYVVGIMLAFQEELKEGLNKEYPFTDESGVTYNSYSEYLSDFFNRFDPKTVELVKNQLQIIKNNSFGLEVDSGKQDIVNGKIGINLAWSGDAVYAMDQAYEIDKELYYSLPEVGSNLWFDGWVIPSRPSGNPRSEKETIATYAFLNFLSDTQFASQNMDFTGYTTFIAGENVYNLLLDWFDARTDYLYVQDDKGNYCDVYFIEDDEPQYLDYNLFLEGYHDSSLDNLPLYYDVEVSKDKFDRKRLIDPFTIQDEQNPYYATYGDLTIEHLLNSETCYVQEITNEDIGYFFGDFWENEEFNFYSYLYLPFKEEHNNICCGLEFYCQLPNKASIDRCAIMAFDPINNDNLVKMWEDFKSDPLPIWAIVLLAIEVSLILFLVFFFVIRKSVNKKLRAKRKMSN